MQNFFIFLELQNKLRRKCKKEKLYKNIGVKQLKSSEWNYIKVRSENIKKTGIKLQKSPEKFAHVIFLVILHSNSRNT